MPRNLANARHPSLPPVSPRYPIPPDLVGMSGDTPETIAAVEFLVQTTAKEYYDALERHCKSRGAQPHLSVPRGRQWLVLGLPHPFVFSKRA